MNKKVWMYVFPIVLFVALFVAWLLFPHSAGAKFSCEDRAARLFDENTRLVDTADFYYDLYIQSTVDLAECQGELYIDIMCAERFGL